MKTVISASRRTDIPAFYLSWFMDAIRVGEISVNNPLYRNTITRVELNPENVSWIVFWSRNYKNLIKNHSFFSDYQLFFHFTIISHHRVLEKYFLKQKIALKQIASLVKFYGPNRIIWRYDPIVIWKELNQIHTNYNSENYRYLCEHISGLGVHRCYFSFATPYLKFRQRFKKKSPESILLSPEESNLDIILRDMRDIAAGYGISLYSCCNDDLIGNNTFKGKCISGSLLNNQYPGSRVSEAKHATRQDCGCTRSIDIGDYIRHPCPSGCIYCYANPVWE